MEINEKDGIIINNNIKYDIYENIKIDNNFNIYITFKRIFFNLFKKSISEFFVLELGIKRFYLDSYLNNKCDFNYFRTIILSLLNNKESNVFIIYNYENINIETFISILDRYRIMNLLTDNKY